MTSRLGFLTFALVLAVGTGDSIRVAQAECTSPSVSAPAHAGEFSRNAVVQSECNWMYDFDEIDPLGPDDHFHCDLWCDPEAQDPGGEWEGAGGPHPVENYHTTLQIKYTYESGHHDCCLEGSCIEEGDDDAPAVGSTDDKWANQRSLTMALLGPAVHLAQ